MPRSVERSVLGAGRIVLPFLVAPPLPSGVGDPLRAVHRRTRRTVELIAPRERPCRRLSASGRCGGIGRGGRVGAAGRRYERDGRQRGAERAVHVYGYWQW